MDKKMADFLYTKRPKTYPKLIDKENIPPSNVAATEDVNILRIKDGKIILDETELYIRKTHLQGPVLQENDEIPATAATYAIKKSGKRWNVADTSKFYEALGHWGMDFSVIKKVFPNRTRKEVKNKFNQESKKNKEKIDDILKNWNGFDLKRWDKLDKDED